MRSCALCKFPAFAFCESDRAALCWDCDADVHGANFLVARHSRTLLCYACFRRTPWTASGVRLGRAASICPACVDTAAQGVTAVNHDNMHDGGDAEEDDDGSGEDEEDDSSDDDGDGDNQVVPMSSSSMTPPPSASSSSSDEPASRLFGGKKRDGGRPSDLPVDQSNSSFRRN